MFNFPIQNKIFVDFVWGEIIVGTVITKTYKWFSARWESHTFQSEFQLDGSRVSKNT